MGLLVSMVFVARSSSVEVAAATGADCGIGTSFGPDRSGVDRRIGVETADEWRIGGKLVVDEPLADAQPRLFGVAQLQRPLRFRQIALAGPVVGHVAVTRSEPVVLILLLLFRHAEELGDGEVRGDLNLTRALTCVLRRVRRSRGDVDELLRVRAVHLDVKVEGVAGLAGRRSGANQPLLRGGSAGRQEERGEEHEGVSGSHEALNGRVIITSRGKRTVQRGRLSVVLIAKGKHDMKKRNALIATILAVGVLTVAPLLDAAPGRHRGPGGHGGPGIFGHLKHLQEELDLSQAQVDQIRGIFAELKTQNEGNREQVRGGFHAVAETLLKNPNDLSAAQAMLDQQTAAERAMKANMLAATAKAFNVLTADQRAELAQIIEDRGERRRERRGKRP